MNLNISLAGKRIAVVGGATGIGRATVELCAQRGAQVIIADFNEAEGRAAAAANQNASFHRVNVAEEASVKALFAEIAQAHGSLDALIQTAGVLKGAYVPLDEFSVEMFREVFDINTVGSFLCSKYAVPLLKRGNKPAIILLSSAAAAGGSSSYAYGTSKGGVSSLGITLANKLADDNIRVNVVCPGNISTAMKLSVIEADAKIKGQDPKEAIQQFAATSGLGEPIGVAKLLAFLASDDADYVRGSIATR